MADLLLVCYLANATCAIINIMTTLIFIILIVTPSHAFFLVFAVRSSLHVLMAVAVILYFHHSAIFYSYWLAGFGRAAIFCSGPKRAKRLVLRAESRECVRTKRHHSIRYVVALRCRTDRHSPQQHPSHDFFVSWRLCELA